jgi:hypothetical protein
MKEVRIKSIIHTIKQATLFKHFSVFDVSHILQGHDLASQHMHTLTQANMPEQTSRWLLS